MEIMRFQSLEKAFVFQKICLKAFHRFRIKTGRSLKRRATLKNLFFEGALSVGFKMKPLRESVSHC